MTLDDSQADWATDEPEPEAFLQSLEDESAIREANRLNQMSPEEFEREFSKLKD